MNKRQLTYTTTKNGRKRYVIVEAVAKELLSEAMKALAQCYPIPNQGYAVALLTSKGNVYTGASYGSDTATLTMHSEMVALAHAAQHGETEIAAITGPNCHICKQIIWESSLKSGVETVIVLREKDEVKKIPISKVMPYPWPDIEGNI